jgi:hypothetical protein
MMEFLRKSTFVTENKESQDTGTVWVIQTSSVPYKEAPVTVVILVLAQILSWLDTVTYRDEPKGTSVVSWNSLNYCVYEPDSVLIRAPLCWFLFTVSRRLVPVIGHMERRTDRRSNCQSQITSSEEGHENNPAEWIRGSNRMRTNLMLALEDDNETFQDSVCCEYWLCVLSSKIIEPTWLSFFGHVVTVQYIVCSLNTMPSTSLSHTHSLSHSLSHAHTYMHTLQNCGCCRVNFEGRKTLFVIFFKRTGWVHDWWVGKYRVQRVNSIWLRITSCWRKWQENSMKWTFSQIRLPRLYLGKRLISLHF